MAEKLSEMDLQDLADEGKRCVVRAFHVAFELHKRACEGQNPADVRATGKLFRMVSELKDEALILHGGLGGISVKSGGT